jgi:hypothetical protein
MSDERVSLAEACALLEMSAEDVAELIGGPDDPAAVHRLTIRHVLAAQVASSLRPLVTERVAIEAGITAGRDAQLKADRMLVVAVNRHGELGACWREAASDWHVHRPFIGVPADLWLGALTIGLEQHRRAAATPN